MQRDESVAGRLGGVLGQKIMSERKELVSEEASKSTPEEVAKKPYVKPSLRRLGTVQELTHGHPSKGAGK